LKKGRFFQQKDALIEKGTLFSTERRSSQQFFALIGTSAQQSVTVPSANGAPIMGND